MKKLSFIKKSNGHHWVGNGFPVRNIFSYRDIAEEISPFLLLDYAGPREFSPTTEKRGVGEHPHRGFETVTLVYDGEVEHRDSSGGGGKISPGDVQWMTAAGGLVHDEFHSKAFAKTGGLFEVVQLWVNLPKKAKMNSPGYQPITSEQIPKIKLPRDAGEIRIIAGDYNKTKGSARTFTPINLWDAKIKAGETIEFTVPKNHTATLFVLKGKIQTSEGEFINEAELGVFEREGEKLSFKTLEDTTLLFLGGEPLNEPVVGHGPFVMNSEDEIQQAFIDFQNGKMGRL